MYYSQRLICLWSFYLVSYYFSLFCWTFVLLGFFLRWQMLEMFYGRDMIDLQYQFNNNSSTISTQVHTNTWGVDPSADYPASDLNPTQKELLSSKFINYRSKVLELKNKLYLWYFTYTFFSVYSLTKLLATNLPSKFFTRPDPDPSRKKPGSATLRTRQHPCNLMVNQEFQKLGWTCLRLVVRFFLE